MTDKVIFGELSFNIPTGYTEQDIRDALEDNAPAIVHAKASRSDNGDGTFTWRFVEVAGTKGC